MKIYDYSIIARKQLAISKSATSNSFTSTCCYDFNNNTNLQEIPVISMTLQTDINGNNMGEAAFNVYDSVSYCTKYPCNKSDKKSKCCQNIIGEKTTNFCSIVTIPVCEVKLTQYSEYPPLQKVLRGKGCTFREKATAIKDDPNLEINDFMLRLATYGMLKYIISRLITGEFNLKWLLQKNNKKFFIKLEQSRLCRFIEAFNSPEIRDYNKYFK